MGWQHAWVAAAAFGVMLAASHLHRVSRAPAGLLLGAAFLHHKHVTPHRVVPRCFVLCVCMRCQHRSPARVDQWLNLLSQQLLLLLLRGAATPEHRTMQVESACFAKRSLQLGPADSRQLRNCQSHSLAE